MQVSRNHKTTLQLLLLTASLIAGALHTPSIVYAQASKGTESNAGPSSGGGSSKGSNGSQQAIFGLGTIIINGIQNSIEQSDENDRRAYEEFKRKNRAREQRIQREVPRIEEANKGAAGTNPWAKSGKKSAKNSDTRAPYADAQCVDIKQHGSGVSWDYVQIFNKCSFPIQVLTCYYDKGEGRKCDKNTAGSWGNPGTIKPKSSINSVSSSKRPGFGVRFIVCNMSGVKNHSKLCLHPQS